MENGIGIVTQTGLRIKQGFIKYWGIVLIAFFVCMSLLFVMIKGENIYIAVNDCLDSNIVWFKMYRDTYMGEAEGLPLVRFLGGDKILERLFIFPPQTLKGLIYYLLPPFAAYVFMFFLKILISVSGWFFMAYAILKKEEVYKNINYIAVCGLLYGIIPVWPINGCNFAAMPWMLAALKNIYDSGKVRYYVLTVFLTYEFLNTPLYGPFLLGYVLIFICIELIRTKKLNYRLVLVTAILFIANILPNITVIKSVASGDTIRSLFSSQYEVLNLREFVALFKDRLINGQYHYGACQKWFVFPCCFIAAIVITVKGVLKRDKQFLKDPVLLTFLWAVFNAFTCAVVETDAIMRWVTKLLPVLKTISLSRIMWWNPFALYLCFFLIIIRVRKFDRIKFGAVFLCAGGMWAILFKGTGVSLTTMYNDIGNNIKYEFKRLQGKETNYLTWKEFYSEELFEKIKNEIDYKGEWAIAFEMHPAILSYNKICTLDGYYSGYSASYKKQFSKLIAPFLETDSTQVSYFNDSGIRAYVFSCKPGDSYGGTRYLEDDSEEMLIDEKVFREMGGKYVFSRVKISNYQKLMLEFKGCFTDEKSPYEIYVYEASQ